MGMDNKAVRCIMGMIGKKRNNYRIVLAKGICLALEFKLGSIEQLREQLTHDKQLSQQILDKYISNKS